jgi:acetyl esterase/lipase
MARMPEPSRSILDEVVRRDVAAIGRRLEPHIAELTADPRLSPERSPAARTPVFLLHGLDDNVIPSSEAPLLADYLRRHGTPSVRWLLTPAVSHVGFGSSLRPDDLFRLVLFWGAVLRATS